MKDPKKFAKEKMSKGDYATETVGCGTGLAGKICRHNQKKLNHFVQVKKMKKSIDFKNTSVAVDPKDQLLAEVTTSPALISYITNNLGILKAGPGASVQIPFPTGLLTLSEREAGVYHGHFQDRDGQVVEKFDSQTIAIIAKTMQLKSLVPTPTEPQSVPVGAPQETPSTTEMAGSLTAAHDRIDSVHNRIDDLQRQVIDQVKGKSIKLKYGDFELEIRKSVQTFVNDFKAGRVAPSKDVVRKAITSWRKKNADYLSGANDHQAAKELMTNWDQHQDSFCQFVDALSRGEDEQG